MKIETMINLPMAGVDEHGNKVPPSKDVIIMQRLNENVGEDSSNNQKLIEQFEADTKAKFQGRLAINENFETIYIPPYDDIAGVLRHKFNGNHFVIVDLSKVSATAFLAAERVNKDTLKE